MITDNDIKIANYIESVGLCTAKQIAKIFYKDRNQGQAIARRRLKKLTECNYLYIKSMPYLNNTNIYIYNSKKNKNLKLTLHKIILLDYYAELLYHDVKMKYFKKDQTWQNGKIKSDGFFVFDFNNKTYLHLIEVAITNFSPHSIEKYNKLYYSNQLQNTFNKFPTVIVIDNGNHFNKVNSPIKFVHLDTKLNDFFKVFV